MALLTRPRAGLTLLLRRQVAGSLDGIHTSIHVGRSLDFVDLRDYVPGDDVADIDWRATARTGAPLVRRHVAERRTTLLVLVATGRNLAAMSSPASTKDEVALLAAGTLGLLATAGGDEVSLLWSDGSGVRVSRPSTREVELERQLVEAERACSATVPAADLTSLLEAGASALRRKAVAAVISDAVALDAAAESALRRLCVQHEVLWLQVPDADPTDVGFGPSHLVDALSGEALPDWLDDATLRRELAAERSAASAARESTLMRLGVAHTTLGEPQDVVRDVLSLTRRRRRGR